MGIFEQFKEGVIAVRKTVEEFKNNHKMASEAISEIIDSLPPPLNNFGNVIWNGLEKQDDSGQKMLEILEKIENNNEGTFLQITASIEKLIKNNASKEDLISLGQEIRNSNKEVIEILADKLDEILSQVKETQTDVKKIKLGVEMLLKQGASGQTIQIQNLRTIELYPMTYRGEKRIFVGRESYMQEVKEHLNNPGTRVSVIGLGGNGKSALAFKVLHRCEGIFLR